MKKRRIMDVFIFLLFIFSSITGKNPSISLQLKHKLTISVPTVEIAKFMTKKHYRDAINLESFPENKSIALSVYKGDKGKIIRIYNQEGKLLFTSDTCKAINVAHGISRINVASSGRLFYSVYSKKVGYMKFNSNYSNMSHNSYTLPFRDNYFSGCKGINGNICIIGEPKPESKDSFVATCYRLSNLKKSFEMINMPQIFKVIDKIRSGSQPVYFVICRDSLLFGVSKWENKIFWSKLYEKNTTWKSVDLPGWKEPPNFAEHLHETENFLKSTILRDTSHYGLQYKINTYQDSLGVVFRGNNPPYYLDFYDLHEKSYLTSKKIKKKPLDLENRVLWVIDESKTELGGKAYIEKFKIELK